MKDLVNKASKILDKYPKSDYKTKSSKTLKFIRLRETYKFFFK